MDSNRRVFLVSSLASAVAAAGWPLFTRVSFGQQNPRGQARPDNSDDLPAPDPKTILEHNQEKIQTDIERLYTLAGELRDEVKKSNSTDVLSLDLLKKAEEVERLAHQIRSLAKG
jgi:hypothetical protein